MKNFDELLEVASILNGPGGCAWDQKQTFQTLQQYVLEEAHEVLEAVDHDDDHKIVEELGDLLYTIVFYAKVAQRTGRFTMEEIIDGVKEKLVRRHPHVFGDLKIETEEELEKNWDRIKSQEEGKKMRSHPLEGVPSTMPVIARVNSSTKPSRSVCSRSTSACARRVLSSSRSRSTTRTRSRSFAVAVPNSLFASYQSRS